MAIEQKIEKTVVAVFDFDGTITFRDTLISFLVYAVGPVKFGLGLICLIPSILAFFLGFLDRQKLKERFLTYFFRGSSFEEAMKIAVAFDQEKMGALIRPEALKRLQWHQEQGHRCILVSASIDLYLTPWAKEMGFQDLLCSRLEVDSKGKITGKLVGKNCRSKEKVVRLKELLGDRSQYFVYAYGDSRGDDEMLAWSDKSYFRVMPEESGS